MNSYFIELILFINFLYNDKTFALNTNCGQYCDCGPPARPPETTVLLTNKKLLLKKNKIFYENESIVKYKCLDQNNLLIGTDTRTCVNGKWVGVVPKCGLNLRNSVRLSSIEIFRNDSHISTLELSQTQDFYNTGLYSVPYYLKPRECTEWTVMSGDELWHHRLNQLVDINYLQIVLYSKHNLQNILFPNRRPALKLILKSDSSSSSTGQQLCHLLKQSYKRHYLTLDYNCGTHQSLNQRVDSIVLEYKSQELFKVFTIALCELNGYQMPDDCGSPDHTISTVASNHLKDVYSFTCADTNLMIQGSTNVKCNRSTGSWSNDSPICVIRPYCKLIDNVFGKQMIITYEEINVLDNGDNVIFDGKLAYLQCNGSHNNNEIKLHNTVTQVICRKGQWLGISSLPSCQQPFTQQTKDDFKELTDKLTIILMGIIIGILIIPTILLLKRSLRKKTTVPIESGLLDYEGKDEERGEIQFTQKRN